MIKQLRLKTAIPRDSEQLQISKDSRKVEQVLNEKLITLVQSLQKLKEQGNPLAYSDYREKINTSIRRAVEHTYRIAAEYASNFSKREYYTTWQDLESITNISQSYAVLFNNRIQRFIISVNPSETREQTKKKPSAEFIVNMLTANMTQDVMKQAVVNKSQQILNPVTITTAAETITDAEILDTITNPVVYVWVTSRDDRVCRICSGYEGEAWAYNDAASIPDIPDDTHPNCRCILQLAEAEFIS